MLIKRQVKPSCYGLHVDEVEFQLRSCCQNSWGLIYHLGPNHKAVPPTHISDLLLNFSKGLGIKRQKGCREEASDKKSGLWRALWIFQAQTSA